MTVFSFLYIFVPLAIYIYGHLLICDLSDFARREGDIGRYVSRRLFQSTCSKLFPFLQIAEHEN